MAALAALVACTGAVAAADGSRAPRIVGGVQTTTDEWPWQVALTRDGFFACGGSLIAADVVLTAAHCVSDPDGTPVPSQALRAVFGLTDLSHGDDPGAFAVAVRRSFVSPRFDVNALAAGFDFALLLLDAEVDRETIDLATGAEAKRFEPGDRAWTTGWGLIDGSPQTGSSVLHEVDVRLAECASDLGFSDSLFFCVAGSAGACHGDSGGPLMIRLPGGEFRQIGVTSFSDVHCENLSAWTNVARNPVRGALAEGLTALRNDAPPPAGPAPGADATPPETTITKAPKRTIRTRRERVRVTIRFTATEPGHFTCSLDGRRARRCSSPHTFRVRKGFHRFQVFATDASGNADPIPDTVGWRVKRVASR